MQDNVFDFHGQQEKMKKNIKKTVLIVAIVFVVLVLLSQAFFIVGESEQAVVTRFGVIQNIVVNEDNDFHTIYADAIAHEVTGDNKIPIKKGVGLHFKVPFIDHVQILPSRLYTYISGSEVVNTSEKKQYYVRTYAQWEIADPALFSLKLANMNNAKNQLDNLIPPVIVQAINRLTAENFVSNKEALNTALVGGLQTINKEMANRGIVVKDIQVHQTILPTANIESTYARMKADRAKVAQQTRSEGQEEYRKAVASADLEAKRIEANAVSEAGAIRGDGDASALEIYANAYSADEEFYRYWRSLQALENSINETTTLVLDQNHPLWKELLAYATSTEK